MVLRQALRQLVQSFSLENIRARLLGQDGRRLQQELDTHKLFLYVNLHLQLKSKGAAAVDSATLVAQTQEVPYRQKVALLQQLVSQQVLEMAVSVDEALLQLGDPAEAAASFERPSQPDSDWKQQRQQQQQQQADVPHSGLAYAGMAGMAAEPGSKLVASLSQVSHLAGKRMGFRLGVRRSKINHGAAGDGLFVEEGQVSPGQVVALFPGLVYTKATYAAMPNYPRVDADNPYLIARYDKAVIDSKPWGRGLLTASPSSWPEATSPAAQQLRVLEGRQPYALAHYANHPGAGMQPNTMIAPFMTPQFEAPGEDEDCVGGSGSGKEGAPSTSGRQDSDESGSSNGGAAGQAGKGMETSGAEHEQQSEQQQQQQEGGQHQEDGGKRPPNHLARPRLRAYLPNVQYSADGGCSRLQLLERGVGAVALVACQQINAGEEVFFDYRLSPGLGRPDWYVAVDSRAETRRWS